MKFFITGEVSHDAHPEKFSLISKEIEKKINILMAENDYGDAVESLDIIPTIFSFQFQVSLSYKERKLYRKKDKSTDYRLAIDYNEFINADDEGKRRLLIENILHAIRDLKRKIKKGFDGDKLEADILSLFNLGAEDIRERNEQKAP
ncbi:MAG: Imm44 family immunity protein [bacterium]|nr:Imm44 family immunity protein [bacterium]